MGILFAGLTAFVFAINNLVVKRGFIYSGKRNNGFFMTVFVNVVLLGMIYLIVSTIKGWFFSFSWYALFYFILAGLFTTGLGRLMLFSSIQRIGPSRASALRNSTPVFTVLFALIVLDETITWIPGIGITLLLSGILLQAFVFFRQAETSSTSDQKQMWTGYVLAMLSAVIFGIGQGIRKQGLLLMNDAFFGAWLGAITSLLFLLVSEGIRGELKSTLRVNFTSWNPYYILAGILTSLGPLFFFLALTYIQVSYVSIIAATEPLLTVLISAFLLKDEEEITPSIWVTVALVLCGTLVLTIFR